MLSRQQSRRVCFFFFFFCWLTYFIHWNAKHSCYLNTHCFRAVVSIQGFKRFHKWYFFRFLGWYLSSEEFRNRPKIFRNSSKNNKCRFRGRISNSRSNFDFEVEFRIRGQIWCYLWLGGDELQNWNQLQKFLEHLPVSKNCHHYCKLGVSERLLLCVTTDVYLNLG